MPLPITSQSKKRQLLMVTIVVTGVLGYLAVANSHAAATNVTIDFNKTLVNVPSLPFSGTLSTFGGVGDTGNIITSAKQRSQLAALGPGYYRVPLQWNNGAIVSSAGGGPKQFSGDQWIQNIRAFGGTPMIVLGGTSDNNFTPSDAANMVRHFSGANRVGYYVIGNEPGNGGMSIGTYCNLFNASVSAMKAVDPTIKVAGPAWAFYDSSTIDSFLDCAGGTVDIIDYHHYGMGTTFLSSADALAQTATFEAEVQATKAKIAAKVPARAAQIEVQVGEYNFSWRTGDGYAGYNGDDRFYQAVNTVWSASAAGHILKGGGRGHQYSDQNGALSLTFEQPADAQHFGRTQNDPMPIYQGIRMFSGGSLFRGFGSTVVLANTTLPSTEVFASNNQKSVVLINKSSTAAQTAQLQLTGLTTGTAQVWQTDQTAPFAAPRLVTTATIAAGSLAVQLPPYSVTTLVIASPTAATPIAVTPAPPSKRGDANHDGRIDVLDLSALLSKWGTADSAEDLNSDGTVNVLDLSLLLGAWG